MTTPLLLTEAELAELTAYSQPGKQLAALHAAGYVRARLGRDGRVVLERAHYEAVNRGEFAHYAKPSTPNNVAELRTGWMQPARAA